MAVGTVAEQTQVAGIQAARRAFLGLHYEGSRSGRAALPRGPRAKNRLHRRPMVARGGLARVRPFTWLPPAVTSGLVHA